VCGRATSGALLLPAAFAVHQLRYLLAFGAGTDTELERTGHSYLHSVVPWLILLLALAAGGFLRALGRAFSRQTTVRRYSLSFVALWVACTGALVAIFAAQELLEGVFATGHPTGLPGIFGYGGWWAVPAAACIGVVLAACFHGARWIVEAVACRAARDRALRSPAPNAAPASQPFRLTPDPLLSGWSPRGPPA
jgi:protein-S-isoprenylcysteine O-methyltransferase Ste14